MMQYQVREQGLFIMSVYVYVMDTDTRVIITVFKTYVLVSWIHVPWLCVLNITIDC